MLPETFYIPTDDGWTLALHHYPAMGAARHYPVLMVHGLGANRLNFDLDDRYSFARATRARGFDVYVLEMRGAGMSCAPGGRDRTLYSWGFADYAERDFPTAVSYVLERANTTALHAVGHSMGGMICYALGSQGIGELRSIVTVGSPLISALNLGTMERRMLQLAAGLGPAVTFTPAPQRRVPLRRLLGTAGMFGQLSTRLADNFLLNGDNCDAAVVGRMAREAIDDIPLKLIAEITSQMGGSSSSGPYDYEFNLGNIRAPVLVISGAVDKVATPASVRAAVERLTGSDVRWRQMGLQSGDRADYGHVDLMVGRNAPEEVYPVMLDFLQEVDG